jgi:serine/threonine protein kinase/TPR repeat protein
LLTSMFGESSRKMAEAERYQHYQVLRREDGSLWELGRGAMGITYKAYDTNLRCPVALKVINNAYLTSEVARQRFLREARAAAALRHQNVASVFHLGTDHESYFYAMEFIDGETVDVYMKRKGPMDPAEALLITLQVSRALAAAAKQNLVHRDLKPANLMLVDEEGEMVVKVIDFGLAKSAKREGDDSGTLTVGGGFVGTPHFASPEQLEERDIDIRSDIYSLGATLYYMIAGRPPYSGSVAQIMSQHLYKPLPLEPLQGTAPCVVELIQKMMEKDRAKRPNSPAELRRDLFSCLEQIQASASAAARIGILQTVTEQPDTLATLALGSVSPEFLATGVTVAGRYQITHELGEIPQGHQYVAEDLQKGRRVGMLVFNSEFLTDKQRYTLLEQEVEQLRRAGQPQIQEIYSLESVGQTSFLVTEFVAGPQLVKVLRVRSVLTPPEALLLLRFLAPVADHAQTNRLQEVDLTVSGVRLFAAGLNDMPADTVLLQKPLTQWLGLGVKVAPIDFSLSPADPVTWAGAATLVKSPSAGGSRGSYLRMLSLLIYELLGGPRSAVESTGRYKPISALSEEGNSILRRGLVDDLGSSAEMARLLEGQIFLRGSESAAAAAAPPVTTMRTDGFPSHSAQSSSGSSSVPEPPAPPTAPAKAQPPLPPSESSAPPPPPLPPPVEISLVMPASTPEKRKISTAGVFLVGVLALLIASGLGFLIYAVIEIMPATRPGVSVSPAPVPTVSPSALPKKSVTPVPHPSALQTPEPRTTISPQPQESITPSSTPEERPTVEPSRSPEQVRSPEPSPSAPSATPEIDDYQKQLGEAQEMVRQGDWQGALKSYLDLADRYPDRRAALTRIDNLLAELRNTEGKIDPAAYPQLKPYFVRAAEKGAVPAMLILGKFSRDAEPSEAMKWYENAAAKGSVPAMIEAGLLYSNRRQPGDDRKALEHFLHAASIGDRVGKYLAGECYYFGKGVQADTTKAVEFLQEAAALREPRAMDLLGTYYRRLRQFDQARKFYEDAAAAGYALSLSNLGVLYMNGEGVQRSPELAANLFKQGAEKGESSGMFFYANCLQDGLGVPKDLKAAADWFRRSAHAGNQRAIEWCRQNGISYK